MSYVTDWGGVAAIWGFVTLLFVPYLGPLVLGITLLVAAIALVGMAVFAAGALVAAPYRLGRFARRTWQARAAARQPSPSRADARALAGAANQLPAR